MSGGTFRRAAAMLGLILAGLPLPAAGQDADLCLTTAERADAGETLSDAEKKKAHEACLRALSDTASVVQKYQFQEADFAITGSRGKD
jgi:hypothetical protein